MASLRKGVLLVTYGHLRKRLKLGRLGLIGELNPIGEINPVDGSLDSTGKQTFWMGMSSAGEK